jgi:hypothetical protein
MSGFETRLSAGENAENVLAAFYGFVERHGRDVDGPAHIRTEIDADGPRLTVRLWSAEALDAFLRDLSARGPQ